MRKKLACEGIVCYSNVREQTVAHRAQKFHKSEVKAFMAGDKTVTIDDVAKALGVSKTTVSRAISGKGRISEATKARVRAYIEENDYRPNAFAKGLAQSKTYNLGWVVPADYVETDVLFFMECMNGVCEAAAEYHYDVLLSTVSKTEISQVEQMIYNSKVDGVIISRAVVDSKVQKFLDDKHVPYVVIGQSTDSHVAWVDNKNREACMELTGVLLEKGCRKLVLAGGDETHLVTGSRKNGFLDAYCMQGMKPEEELIFSDVDNYAKAEELVEKALAEKADGIICMDDFISNLVLACLKVKYVGIPEEMFVASFYVNVLLQHHNPSVTAIRFDTKLLGRNACMKVLALLGETTDSDVALPGYQICMRDSTDGTKNKK